MYRCVFKRIMDFTIASFGLIVAAPIFLVIVLLLFITNNGQPFFVQGRPGKNGKIFNLVKFKTMNDHYDEQGKLLPDAERLTKIGRFVRSTSLDELPQLINVIKGDMSLIGPRPLLVQYLPLYNAYQARRHEVLPGITGWAQINGRNALSWEQKFEFDIYYVQNLSLTLDIKIFILTLKRVIKREGITSDSSPTMERFTGSPS